MRHKLQLLGALCLTLLFSLTAPAQSVPPLINYQGRLTDQTGAPLTAGAYGLQFRLWDSPTAANASDLIWGQQQNVTVQSNGVFNVILGSPGGSPIPGATPAVNNLAYAFAGSNAFLGVTIMVSNGTIIATPNEILPRQQLLSVPYAFGAGTAATVAPGSITTASLVAGLIQTTNLADGSVTLGKLAPRPVGANVGIGGVAISPSSGTAGTVANLVVTLVTTGRPVFAFLTSDGSNSMVPTPGNGATNGPAISGGFVSESGLVFEDFGFSQGGWITEHATMSLVRNGTPIAVNSMFASSSQNNQGVAIYEGVPGGAFSFLDLPPAGTNRYSIQISTVLTTNSVIYNSVLAAFEL